ncbi:MAG: membrane integrity-associated transporter subunit PqiC [Planctomycetes bacterium]|nr:membrane integrity-associated transporter subunit PqiC [Planctomycetota bacterium]
MRMTAMALLLPLLAGCISLSKDYPDRHLHALAAERPGDGRAGRVGAILAVKPFTIAPSYEGNEFVYRKSETEWESDYYNAFFVPPREMATDAARSWLARAGLFELVTDMSSSITPTHVLEGHVSQLWVDARTDSLQAVVEVEFLLADDRKSPATIVIARSYAERVPMNSDTPEEAVKAWGRGLRSTLEKLEADLGEAGDASAWKRPDSGALKGRSE